MRPVGKLLTRGVGALVFPALALALAAATVSATAAASCCSAGIPAPGYSGASPSPGPPSACGSCRPSAVFPSSVLLPPAYGGTRAATPHGPSGAGSTETLSTPSTATWGSPASSGGPGSSSGCADASWPCYESESGAGATETTSRQTAAPTTFVTVTRAPSYEDPPSYTGPPSYGGV
ncbi:uncharacterized protein MAM_04850 [Metarhizium album ARSEF 1941]|uniref:Uncharacterized protein n=1 Tax=Metarhizium album (strain ARSEF 1941) TaxID=1081103 RepID=A0A0B2WTC3_METAS|nr:uncharacterized protein MAM_04850 [Metarhizium album ARSEF 1941]KHN97253.1 hypothetical protein MAM_04850 [Metarhizium album ARSEF 1941]